MLISPAHNVCTRVRMRERQSIYGACFKCKRLHSDDGVAQRFASCLPLGEKLHCTAPVKTLDSAGACV